MNKINYSEVVQLKQLQLDIDNVLTTYKNNEQLMYQNIILFRQNSDESYLNQAIQNLTNMNNNTNHLEQYYTKLFGYKDIIITNDPNTNTSAIDNTIYTLKLQINNANNSSNKLND
jgi:hypothetical protein